MNPTHGQLLAVYPTGRTEVVEPSAPWALLQKIKKQKAWEYQAAGAKLLITYKK